MTSLIWSVGCVRTVQPVAFPPPPAVLSSTPDVYELAKAVNRSDAIQQLSTNSATMDVLTMPAVPKLSTTLNLQRDKRFRMKAAIPFLMGSGIDLGSNESEFWFEVPDPKMMQTLYHARHDQYAQQLTRAVLPVDPTWIIEALGLARLDPAAVLGVPVMRSDGLIEVRSAVPTPSGTYQRVCFIEPEGGYITHLFLEAPDGRQVAKSVASDHRYNETVDCVLPHRVKIELFPAAGPPLAMQLEVASYTVNQLLSGDPDLFTMPTNNRNKVDLVQMANMSSIPLSTNTPIGSRMSTSDAPWTGPTGLPGPPAAYSANAPTGPPLRGTRYE